MHVASLRLSVGVNSMITARGMTDLPCAQLKYLQHGHSDRNSADLEAVIRFQARRPVLMHVEDCNESTDLLVCHATTQTVWAAWYTSFHHAPFGGGEFVLPQICDQEAVKLCVLEG